jgi:hypothetical protein
MKLSSNDDDIVKVLRTLKSYTATQLLKQLIKEVQSGDLPLHHLFVGNSQILQENPKCMLEYFSLLAKEDLDQSHRFWQRDSDVKLIDSNKFLIQKLQYIHNNPVRERWNIIKEPDTYPFSSCRYYENGKDWNNLNIQSLF